MRLLFGKGGYADGADFNLRKANGRFSLAAIAAQYSMGGMRTFAPLCGQARLANHAAFIDYVAPKIYLAPFQLTSVGLSDGKIDLHI